VTATGPFDHPWLSGLLGDADMAAIWSAERTLDHMRSFEASFSRAMGHAGLFVPAKAIAAADAIMTVPIDLDDLKSGMARDGVVVPRLVTLLRQAAGPDAVHAGATSQDVIDTALVLTLRETAALLDARLGDVTDRLDALERRHGDAPLSGRTRMQLATTIRVRDRVATWRLALERHRISLTEHAQRVACLQLGGASGDRQALGPHADRVAAELARELGLSNPPRAWHAMRGDVVAYSGVLALISGSLAKMGQDICLMAQQGIDEISLSGGGASSAMPHKRNPFLAETLVTLGRFNAVQAGGMQHAMIHEQERSGAAWTLEWMLLPQMALATGRALCIAADLCRSIEGLGGPER